MSQPPVDISGKLEKRIEIAVALTVAQLAEAERIVSGKWPSVDPATRQTLVLAVVQALALNLNSVAIDRK